MRNYVLGIGASALVLMLGCAPTIVLAENSGNDDARGSAQVTSSVGGQGQGSVESEDSSESERASSTGAVQDDTERTQEVAQRTAEKARERVKYAEEKTIEMMKEGVPFMLEGTTTAAMSLEQLKHLIEQRHEELDQEEASSSPKTRDILKNVNPVRLAVHSLLASRDLLDDRGIGEQVSEVAREMNRSIASTTAAEAKIQTRGFLTRLFFGGDTTSAEIIAQEATQNQQRIDDLTALVGQASTTAAVRATLNEQIAVLRAAQVRLQVLADREKSAWGLFSWRF